MELIILVLIIIIVLFAVEAVIVATLSLFGLEAYAMTVYRCIVTIVVIWWGIFQLKKRKNGQT